MEISEQDMKDQTEEVLKPTLNHIFHCIHFLLITLLFYHFPFLFIVKFNFQLGKKIECHSIIFDMENFTMKQVAWKPGNLKF